MLSKRREKKLRSVCEPLFLLILLGLFFGGLGSEMGITNFFSTLTQTAYRLLIDTVLYIMAIAVLAGAVGRLMGEFGVIRLMNTLFAPLMRPLFGLPGGAFLGIITTYLSDNPAIIALAKDNAYLRHFRRYEIPCLCNLGTTFGMGLVVFSFMALQGYMKEALLGQLAAVIGGVVSVRLMHLSCRRNLPADGTVAPEDVEDLACFDTLPDKSAFERFLTAILEGGRYGVDVGVGIIPGVLVICTVVIMLTFGPADPAAGYKGLPFEGVPLLPILGQRLSPILSPLFGFESPAAIAFPITALGAVGAALSLVPKFLADGIAGGNEITVFTAMGMCWSGFLSTHVVMLNELGFRSLVSHAIRSHFIGGIVAGVAAHYLWILLA